LFLEDSERTYNASRYSYFGSEETGVKYTEEIWIALV